MPASSVYLSYNYVSYLKTGSANGNVRNIPTTVPDGMKYEIWMSEKVCTSCCQRGDDRRYTTFPQEGRWQPTEDITSCCQRVAATRLSHEKVEDTQLLLILMCFQLIHYYTHLIVHNQEVHAPINWDSAIEFVAPRSYRVRDFPEKLSLDSLPFNFLPWDFQLRTKICY